MSTTETKTTWHSIDVDTLNPEQAKLLTQLKAANKAASALREAFDKAFTAGYEAPAGYKLAISHRFGLAVAVVKDDKRNASPKGAKSLTEFLKHAIAA